ncbi:hypothetical protein EVAR_48656_1 [Eumeta japonica]|uniref:Odorant receptor n=1 Tax=Eumeta variegata TaxID=151549 RepID=A0A4C1X7C3_EUMVA|nr:hypothetical protein EVAR_48656_1 [Eumeta japonica]
MIADGTEGRVGEGRHGQEVCHGLWTRWRRTTCDESVVSRKDVYHHRRLLGKNAGGGLRTVARRLKNTGRLKNTSEGFGLANCWYETGGPSRVPKAVSLLWTCVSMTYLTAVVVSELMANFRSDLTVAERNDAIVFTLAHPVIIYKIMNLYVQRNKIKVFLEAMLEDEGSIDTSEQIEFETVKKFKMHCFILSLSMFMAISTGTINAITFYFLEGIPVRTLVPYWPTSTDHGMFVNIIKFLVNFHWWTEFLENSKGKKKEDLEKAMADGFIKGVKYHAKTLWCAQNLQNALGSIYSVQVIQSISLLAMSLYKQVKIEYTLTTVTANMAFIMCMLVLTGCYMIAAGDITYQAGLVSYAMFSCGWEHHRNLRFFLVMGIQRAHKPVVMTAFGIFDLSYRNFISVSNCRSANDRLLDHRLINSEKGTNLRLQKQLRIRESLFSRFVVEKVECIQKQRMHRPAVSLKPYVSAASKALDGECIAASAGDAPVGALALR